MIDLEVVNQINDVHLTVGRNLRVIDLTPTLRGLILKQINDQEIKVLSELNKLLEKYNWVMTEAIKNKHNDELADLLTEGGITTE